MAPINGVQAFDIIGWLTGGSDDPSPHQYLFYKNPTENHIRILESTNVPGDYAYTKWTHSNDVIAPSGAPRFSDTTQIAAASTFGLGYSGNKKMIRVFAFFEDRTIRDYVWYPDTEGWRQGDLLYEAKGGVEGQKFAAKAYDYGGAACFSFFYQDNDGWVHEGRKYGEDEWHFQIIGEMTGNNPGLWVNIWQQNGVLNKRILAQNLAIDARFRDYTYEPTLWIWNPATESQAGVPFDIPATLNGGVTITGLTIFNNPRIERIYYNNGDQNIEEFCRSDGNWTGYSPIPVSDAKPYTPLASVGMSKSVGSTFKMWKTIVYINQAGNLAQVEYRYGGAYWMQGIVIEV